MENNVKNIIVRFRQAIEDSGLSYATLEQKTGFARATLNRYASGKTEKVPMNCIEAVAQATGVSPAWIMGWDGQPKPVRKRSTVPLLGTIACGIPILADENIESYIDTPEPVKADFALRCKGDSMINARIFDGDIVYIRRQETVENGEIAAVLIGTEATLKKVYVYPNRIELRAENPLYKPIEVEGAEMSDVKILGKAVWFLSRVQ